MGTVSVLQHSYELGGYEETKFIGVYSTREAGESAIERLRTKPGFGDHPDGFHLDSYDLDEDHWTGGFSTVRNPE